MRTDSERTTSLSNAKAMVSRPAIAKRILRARATRGRSTETKIEQLCKTRIRSVVTSNTRTTYIETYCNSVASVSVVQPAVLCRCPC